MQDHRTGATAPSRSDKLGSEIYLRIDNLRKEFDGIVAVDGVNLAIRRGEIFAILGASGSGKSTLLRMLAGFEIPTSGRIELDGSDMARQPPYERPVNMMFQSYALFPHMTVADNIAFGLKQDRMPKAQIRARVEEMLALVHLERVAKRKPHQISGGQAQRVALARSLAKSPKLLLLDEPMGALDKKLRSEMQLEVANIIERLGVTCVLVTHDQEEAMTMAHRIAIMESGRVMQVGSPNEIYEQPANRYTAQFIGTVNMIEGLIEDDEPDHVSIRSAVLPDAIWIGHGQTGYVGMPVAFALRPEKISLSRERPQQPHNCYQGRIEEIAYFGSHTIYHLRLPSGFKMLAHAANAQRWAADRFTWNDEVWMSWDDIAGVVLNT